MHTKAGRPVKPTQQMVSTPQAGLVVATRHPRTKVPLAPDLDAAHQVAREAAAKNTRRAYSSDWRIFSDWCGDHQLVAVPCSERTLLLFNQSRAAGGCALSTISRGIQAIRKANKAAKCPDPFGVEAREHWRGLRRKNRRRPLKAEPLMGRDIRRMVDCLGTVRLHDLRARALVLVGYALAMRRSELVAMKVEDVQFVDSGDTPGMRVFIPMSKTDQEAEGEWVAVLSLRGAYCPVKALRGWLYASRITEGPIFLALRGRRSWTGKVMDAGHLSKIVKTLVRKAGLEASKEAEFGKGLRRYSAHGLRSGFVTKVLGEGVGEGTAQKTTRHRSRDQLQGYNQNDPLKVAATHHLGLEEE